MVTSALVLRDTPEIAVKQVRSFAVRIATSISVEDIKVLNMDTIEFIKSCSPLLLQRSSRIHPSIAHVSLKRVLG